MQSIFPLGINPVWCKIETAEVLLWLNQVFKVENLFQETSLDSAWCNQHWLWQAPSDWPMVAVSGLMLMISYPPAILVGYDDTTKWAWEELLRDFEHFVWFLEHHCLPNTHDSPFTELAIHVVRRNTPSLTINSPKECLLPRDAQDFSFSWVCLLWFFRQGKGGVVLWSGMSSSSFLLL